MGKIKSTYANFDGIQVHILGTKKELSLETMAALKKMVKLAYNKTIKKDGK